MVQKRHERKVEYTVFPEIRLSGACRYTTGICDLRGQRIRLPAWSTQPRNSEVVCGLQTNPITDSGPQQTDPRSIR